MGNEHSFIHVSNTHVKEQVAIQTLAKLALDATKLSLINKGCQSEQRPLVFYAANEKIKVFGVRSSRLQFVVTLIGVIGGVIAFGVSRLITLCFGYPVFLPSNRDCREVEWQSPYSFFLPERILV